MADCYHVERLVHYVEWLLCCKICRALNDFVTIENDLYSVEWFILRWMICIMLHDLYYLVRFALHWMITVLNDLYRAEWFALRYKICTELKNL